MREMETRLQSGTTTKAQYVETPKMYSRNPLCVPSEWLAMPLV